MNKECIIDYVLLILQICLFMLGRILDDISWYDVGVPNEVNAFEGVGVAGMTLCTVIQIIRKHKEKEIFKIFFFKSQLKFMIPWALIITACLLFFNIFGCTPVLPDTSYFYVDYTGCCINVTQIILTNLNYSLVCNTKAHMAEFVAYEVILFGEIIYNGTLLILFVNNLEGHSKDLSILLISIIITNQILIMDLLFRAAFEDKERELEEKERMMAKNERQ